VHESTWRQLLANARELDWTVLIGFDSLSLDDKCTLMESEEDEAPLGRRVISVHQLHSILSNLEEQGWHEEFPEVGLQAVSLYLESDAFATLDQLDVEPLVERYLDHLSEALEHFPTDYPGAPSAEERSRLGDPASTSDLAWLERRLASFGNCKRAAVAFYKRTDGLNLGDLWTGFWWHPIELMRKIEVEEDVALALASDGGGRRFLWRPHEGAVCQGNHFGEERWVASGLTHLLAGLANDAEAWAEQRPGHTYLDGGRSG
jgi:hypothetical protein